MKHIVEEVKLKSGARGLLIDVPDATVMSFQFNFRAGSRLTRDKDIYETAHIMEHMAFGANARFKDEHAFEADFTRNGAFHNASTSDYSLDYYASCADFEWDRILDLQQVSITSPKFREDELVAEKGNVKSELTGYLSDYNRILWPRIQQLLGEDTLTYPQRLKTINNVSVKDIREHYQRTHTAQNLRFVVAGKLHGRKTQLKQMLESWDLPDGERFKMLVEEHPQITKPTLIPRKEAPNLTFGLALVLPRPLTDPEIATMGCLDHLLTGTMFSRIMGAARKKGLAYGIWSDTNSFETYSLWDIGGEVNTDSAEEVFDIIVRELKAVLAERLTEDEVEASKQYALGRYQMGAQTVGQIAGFYSGRYFFDGVVNDYEKVPARIEATKRDDIAKLMQEFIDHQTWVLAGVADNERELLDTLHAKLATIFN
ncbi:MAG: pitrilysin family protein [Candidatus Saccharibacteria bacterium]|nr:pitrilysin family protein [Candidatus Saccharibacteria bacterium]